jgi:hypothetical protein
MPPRLSNSLDGATYASINAYLLQPLTYASYGVLDGATGRAHPIELAAAALVAGRGAHTGEVL